MEELPTCTTAHGFHSAGWATWRLSLTGQQAGPALLLKAHSLTAPTVLWEELGSPQRRSRRKNACLHSALSSG